MKTTLIMTVLTTISLTGFGAPTIKKQQVPDRLDKIRLIQPAAAKKNHILLVDVANAIPAKDWSLAATFAISRLQLNVWTNSAAEFSCQSYMLDPDKGTKDFGEKSKVCVFLINDPKLAAFTGAPGHWCAANVSHLKNDNPAPQILRDRYAKTILKGLAYACGSGATLEPGCSLFYGSTTLAGMDNTTIMITPMAYFPMLETLRAIGGPEMLTPAMEE